MTIFSSSLAGLSTSQNSTDQLLPLQIQIISSSKTSMNPERISPPPPPLRPSESSFPVVIIISIIGILATAILLLTYYVFVIKCCVNWRRHSDLIPGLLCPRRPSRSMGRQDIFTVYSSPADADGLCQSAIQTIPILRYRRNQFPYSFFHECAVCLNEFKEEERIRQLPSCFHGFHIDCIDTWLQTHVSCPLCRSELTSSASVPADRIMEPNPIQNSVEMIGDEAWRRGDDGEGAGGMGIQERNGRKKLCNFSAGDECINLRVERGDFAVQPMRRSFSMDSSNDRELYIVVQEILKKKKKKKKSGELQMVMSSGEETSNGGSDSVRRSFFSFGSCRSTKSSVLPLHYV